MCVSSGSLFLCSVGACLRLHLWERLLEGNEASVLGTGVDGGSGSGVWWVWEVPVSCPVRGSLGLHGSGWLESVLAPEGTGGPESQGTSSSGSKSPLTGLTAVHDSV